VHLAQPLLIADLSGSLGSAAFFSAFGTAVHMVGTYLGGWPTERFGARRVLAASTFLPNVCARLVLTRWRQELTPLEHAGGVTAASEFGRTAASVGVDSLVGGAFTSGASAYGSFGIVGGVLGVFAAAQLVLARVLIRKGLGTNPGHPPLTTSTT
jgi:hypothetical protein